MLVLHRDLSHAGTVAEILKLNEFSEMNAHACNLMCALQSWFGVQGVGKPCLKDITTKTINLLRGKACRAKTGRRAKTDVPAAVQQPRLIFFTRKLDFFIQ
eukprot:SAG11_NODE_106_length_16423_cov_51.220840_17_plen_101_part_00